MHRYVVLAFDRRDGSLVWRRDAGERRPHEATHASAGTYASSSAITDGEHVVAFFESNGLYVYDLDGNLAWSKDLGDKRVLTGGAARARRPVLHGNHLVVVWDHNDQSYIVAFRQAGRRGAVADRPGRARTRGPRRSWSSTPGAPRSSPTAGARVRSYDLETGELVWHTTGLTPLTIPSPVAGDGMVFVTSGFNGAVLKAISLTDARGATSRTPGPWSGRTTATPPTSHPRLYYDGALYFTKYVHGILSVFDARAGTPYYGPQRMDGLRGIMASPVAADGRVYVTGRDGTTVVIRHGKAYEVLATNKLDDQFSASMALVGGDIYMRGDTYLYCIAES